MRRLRFDLEGYLDEQIGIRGRAHGDHGMELVCDCPFCGARNKLWANKITGLWTCYKCNEGGGAAALIAEIDGTTLAQARRVLRRGEDERPSGSLATIAAKRSALAAREEERAALREDRRVVLPEEFVPVWDAGRREWNVPVYLRKRGIRLNVAAAYGLGFCLEGRYGGRLIFPAHNFGRLKTFAARAMGPFGPKYIHPPGDDKSGTVYGLDEIIGCEEVVGVEGPTDVLSMVQRGWPTLGLYGKALTMAQANVIRKAGVRRMILLLDADAARDAGRAAALLEETLEVRLARLPEGESKIDPDTAPTELVERVLDAARPPTFRDRIGAIRS